VAKNASMPFKVKIREKAEVEVLGTHFDINAYGDESTTNTTLLEGSVKFTGLVHKDSRIIIPGEQARLDTSNHIKVNKLPNAEQVISWKNGNFDFTNANLDMVLRQLARWYDVNIVFEDTMPKKQFNGEIQRTLNLSQVIRLLEKNGVHSRIEGRNLIVAN
jgi:ferric-dicitrate binding protein FerR (iron transport regulator)